MNILKHRLLKLIPVALVLLFAQLFTVYGHCKDVIFVVYSNNFSAGDPSASETLRDIDYFQRVDSALNYFMYDIDPDIRVVNLASESIRSSDIINKHLQEGDRVRGFVFQGHGNEVSYAFNKKEVFSGETLADLVYQNLSTVPTHSNLFVYFNGCNMANPTRHSPSFQQSFFERLSPQLGKLKVTQLHTLAHISAASMNQINFFQPTTFDRFVFRSKIGGVFDRIQIKLLNLLGRRGRMVFDMSLAILPVLLSASLEESVGKNLIAHSGIGLVVLKIFISMGISKFGKLVSTDNVAYGSVFDILHGSLAAQQKNKCEAHFE